MRGCHFGMYESPLEQKMAGYGYYRKQSTSFGILLGLPDLLAPYFLGFKSTF